MPRRPTSLKTEDPVSIQRREELLEARPMKEAIAGEGEEVREDTKGRKSDVEYSRLLSE
jgi:hypothetical protein